jgi:2-phospho-L-lactate/phosphoenolpyruvate guanylyltransferase
MKELARAKMRLADVLDRHERAELALAMLTDVLAACNDSGCFDVVAVVSSDSDVFWHAREAGAKPLAEPRTIADHALEDALNAGLTFAQRYLARRMAVTELLILPADIPLARPDDLHAIVAALDRAPEAGAIVRARDGGTNALALRPPDALPMRFGRGSADAHRDAADDSGLRLVELSLDRVAFDVDSPEDLDALPSLRTGAATTGWLEARAHYTAGLSG